MFMTCKAKCLKTNYPDKSTVHRKLFKEIQPGDIIEFKVSFLYGGKVKAIYIVCTNTRTYDSEEVSFKQLGNIMQDFEFEDLNKDK